MNSTTLGDLIAHLDRPDVAAGVLTTLDPRIRGRIEERAAAASMAVADFCRRRGSRIHRRWGRRSVVSAADDHPKIR